MGKSLRFSNLAFCFAFLLVSHALGAQIPLTNPGFEIDENGDGVPDGWYSVGSPGHGEIVRSSTEAHSGDAFYVQTQYQVGQNVPSIRPGFRYTVRGFMRRADDHSVSAQARLEIWFPGYSRSLTARANMVFLQQSWVPTTVAGAAPVDTREFLRIQWTTAPGHWVGLDDLLLCDQVLSEASVPSASPVAWIPQGPAEVTQDPTSEHNYVLQMGMGGEWSQEIAAMGGFRATLACWLRAPESAADAEIEVAYANQFGVFTSSDCTAFPVGTEWVPVSYPFAIGKEISLIRITIRNLTENAVLLADDFDLAYVRAPFSPFTPDGDGLRDTIEFQAMLNRGSAVHAAILDASGTLIADLYTAQCTEGYHTFLWDGEATAGPAPQGIYSVLLQASSGDSITSVTDTVELDRSRPLPAMAPPPGGLDFFPRGFFISPPPVVYKSGALSPEEKQAILDAYRTDFEEIRDLSGNAVGADPDFRLDADRIVVAGQSGVRILMSDPGIVPELRKNNRPLYADQAKLTQLVNQTVDAYSDSPGLLAYYPNDEPVKTEQEDTELVMRLFYDRDPDQLCVVSHNVNGVLEFVDRVSPPVFFWYRYPLKQDTTSQKLWALFAEQEYFALHAAQRGLPQWFFFQSFRGSLERVILPGELRATLYGALANGAQGLLGWVYDDATAWGVANAIRNTVVHGESLRQAAGEVFKRIADFEALWLSLEIYEDISSGEMGVYARTLRDTRTGDLYILALNPDPIRPARFEVTASLASLSGSIAGVRDVFTAQHPAWHAPEIDRIVIADRLGPGDAALIHLEGVQAKSRRLPRPGVQPETIQEPIDPEYESRMQRAFWDPDETGGELP